MARTGLPRTKIVATLGPSSDDPSILERMIRAGLSVARINFAHGEKDQHQTRFDRIRKVAQRLGRPVAVLGDLAGPKIRVGELRDGKVLLENGRDLVLTSRPVPGTSAEVSVTEASIFRDVRKNDPIYLADGSLELKALDVRPDEMTCRVVHGGLLLPRKGVNLPRTKLRMPSLTSKDEADLRYAVHAGFDALALSFVRNVKDLQDCRRRLGRARIPIIAKIEKREAIQDLARIMDEADGAMVARGDLGVETSVEEVPILQKRIIRAANDQAKPVVTATQMLKSMVEAPHPTRAEAADIANAIFDGTDAVMLSEETAMGQYPAHAVETMARIARRAEAALDPAEFHARSQPAQFVAGAVSEAAVRVANAVNAAAIVTPTGGGATPRHVIRLRPPMPVLALTRRQSTARFLNFSWGVHPVHAPNLGKLERMLRFGLDQVTRLGWARKGDRVVITAGYPPEGPASNLMTVQTVA